MRGRFESCIGGLLLLVLAGACATPTPPTDVAAALDRAAVAGRDHIEVGNYAEGVQLLDTVLRLDPANERAQEFRSRVPPDVEYLWDTPGLGSNFARRPVVDRPIAQKILLYLPDRLLDLADVLSFDVHVGTLAHVNVHLTRAVQFGAGARAVAGLGWHDQRSFGTLTQAESGLALLGAGAQGYYGILAGTSGIKTTADGIAGLHGPRDRLYQEFRDYWAIGLELTAGVVGLEFDFHPLDMVDFLLGWFTVDILNDDFARTRGSELRKEDTNLILDLWALERESETLEHYLEEQGRATPGAR